MVLCVLCVLQPTAQRIFAGAYFVLITLTHDIFLSSLDGFSYYGSAATGGLLAAVLMTGINPIPKIVLKLQVVCILSAILNFMGWVLWYLYLPPDAYNIAFICLYLYTVIILLSRDKEDVAGITVGGLHSCFRFSHHPFVFYFFKHKDKA